MKALFPYAATTGDVTVRVAVNFLADQSDPAKNRWVWAYHIRIENAGANPVQLLSRNWRIEDNAGGRHRVQGEGVVGEQPVIAPGASYDYVSGCPLEAPSGSMRGSYRMVAEEAEFDVTIPPFALVSPAVAR